MADGGDADEPEEAEEEEEVEPQLRDKEKVQIAKWFLTNAPVGEIKYVAKDLQLLLEDDEIYQRAAAEAFPAYNITHLIALEMPDRSGDVLITSYGEIDQNSYLDPRTAQVATVDHVKQVCTDLRPATDEELPSHFIEEFRNALDVELSKYVSDTYPKGTCAVYCTEGKDLEGPGADFSFAAVISAARHSPQNFWAYREALQILSDGPEMKNDIHKYNNGSWRSIWNIEFKDEAQIVKINGKMQVGAHYFEEGNVQLDANNECKDSTILQSPEDCAVSITNMIRHHETEYMTSLENSYFNLPDTTFKDLRRKLPITRTLFQWHHTLQYNLNKDISKELGIGK